MRNDEEHRIQCGIIDASAYLPECNWLHAIPNGGLRTKATGARLKAEGVKAGIADLFLPVPVTHVERHSGLSHHGIELAATKFYHGLYIEVKTRTGRQTKEQREFESAMVDNGYKYKIVRSMQEGIDAILEYIGRKKR